MTIDERIADLIKRGFVSSAFQPIVDLENSRIIGYEALMRGPKGTPLAKPGLIFGPRSRLSSAMTMHLDAACIAAALRSGHLLVPYAKLFINVHITTLMAMERFRDRFMRLLESSGVSPSSVVIEISERTSDPHLRVVSRILERIRREGVRFALDDFGIAYSGLQHLYRFEPEYVKLDMSLIRGIHESRRKQVLVEATTRMCERLGSEVIAEGVESTDEIAELMAINVPFVQGFHFGRPRGALFWTSERATARVHKPWFSADGPTATME